MIVIENQTVFDIAIQESGSVLTAFDWAVKNGISITDDLDPGQLIAEADSSFKNGEVASYFKGKKQMIATAMKKPPIPPGLGIGFMKIGINFKVG
jgi:capsid protein